MPIGWANRQLPLKNATQKMLMGRPSLTSSASVRLARCAAGAPANWIGPGLLQRSTHTQYVLPEIVH